jgi:hypothetical protein
VIAGKEEMRRLVSLALPLIRAGGSCKKIVISPESRYKHGCCCSDRNHGTNILEKGYSKWMENALMEARSTIRDWCRMKNIRNFETVRFDDLLVTSGEIPGYLREEQIWGDDDHVHMTKLAYTEAAARMSSMILDNREEEMTPRTVKPAAKKTRIDLALTRPAWVRGSVAEAVRMEPAPGGWRGSGRARGGQFRGGWGGGGRGDPRGGRYNRGAFVSGRGGGTGSTGSYGRGRGGQSGDGGRGHGGQARGGRDGRVGRGGRGGRGY